MEQRRLAWLGGAAFYYIFLFLISHPPIDFSPSSAGLLTQRGRSYSRSTDRLKRNSRVLDEKICELSSRPVLLFVPLSVYGFSPLPRFGLATAVSPCAFPKIDLLFGFYEYCFSSSYSPSASLPAPAALAAATSISNSASAINDFDSSSSSGLGLVGLGTEEDASLPLFKNSYL